MARKPKALKIAVYLRCSTDDQADREYSTIDTQRDKTTTQARHIVHVANAGGDLSSLLNTAAAKRFAGLPAEFIGEFSDPGKTGTNLERPGYKSLVEAVASGQVNLVVVTYLSRLARGDAFSAAAYFIEHAGAFIVPVEQKYSDDSSGNTARRTQTFIDGLYAEQVSVATKTK